jgi:type IV secretory pathway TraG/TraD family ATPase VirD4
MARRTKSFASQKKETVFIFSTFMPFFTSYNPINSVQISCKYFHEIVVQSKYLIARSRKKNERKALGLVW